MHGSVRVERDFNELSEDHEHVRVESSYNS